MPVSRETLEHRKTHNLCPRDGKPNAPNRKLCETCLAKCAAKTERYRQRKIKNKLCTNCGVEQPIGTSRLCIGCKDKASVYGHNAHIKRYNVRKQSKMCVDCNGAVELDKTLCLSCLERRKNNQQIKRDTFIANTLCSQCGGDLGGSTGKRCQVCIEKRNNWYQGSSTQHKDKERRDGNHNIVLKHYGGKCTKCGESELVCLAIDHMYGEGNTHRRKIKKYGSGFFKWLIDNDFPEGFQVLCHNCNIKKHLNGVP